MSYFNNRKTIKLLQNLLSPSRDESDSETDEFIPKDGVKFGGPSSVDNFEKEEPQEPSTNSAGQTIQCAEKSKTESETEIGLCEDREPHLVADDFDYRQTPEYQIIYKQFVTPEDIYLQIGNRTSSTASCEELCIDIRMPDESVGIEQMELNINQNDIDLKTPIYRLKLPLVQKINPDFGKAQWNREKKILRLNLIMKREFDCINF